MPGEGPATPATPLRVLAAILTGDMTSPPHLRDRRTLLQLAGEHRVEQLAEWHITARGGDPRRWFGEAVDIDETRRLAVVDAIRTRELARVLDALGGVEGAQPLLFKGAALAHTLYPHSWLRPRLDSDILIAPSSAAAACDALASLGYRREPSTSGALVMSQASLTRVDELGLMHALDVHWKIANWHLIARAASHAELAARAAAVPALGPAARAVSDGDALLIACLHRAAHHRDSEDLLWLYDIHLLAGRLADADWTLVLANARRAEVKAVCHRGLTLATEYFQSTVPAAVLGELADADGEPSAIYLSKDVRLVDALMADLRSLPFRDRIRLMVEHLCPPATYMRERYGVTSRAALLAVYARRIATGLPRWFVPGVWS